MTNSTAILNHLQASKIIEVREWAKVLWVKAVVAGKTVCRFVSKKIGVTVMDMPMWKPNMTWQEEDAYYEAMSDYEEAMAKQLNAPSEDDINQAVGDIAKLLPVGANPNSYNVELAATKVAYGDMTIEQAVEFLSSKKPVLRRR